MKIKLSVFLTLTLLTLLACNKDEDSSSTTITSKIWKRALIDKNPSTNPQGAMSYYAVLDCEKDDTFKFESNGNLVINRGANKCETSEDSNNTQTYTLNRANKELLINGARFTLAEESSEQIKYYATLPMASGFSQVIFLLQ
ncbi:hypothetical protein PBAC_23210 [Pedobacter glucosidilyticus]|nr:hypothetical protein [Pedobacter glucosidilyticus]KHJ37477.1 hypothetical protein PBAC_23210 [Pedobacter glucosidilyticus]